MTDNLPEATTYFWALISSLGVAENKLQLLIPAPNLSTKLLQMLLLQKLLGSNLSSKNLEFLPILHQSYGVTTLEPPISPPTPSFMLPPSMRKLTSTLFMTWLLLNPWMFGSSVVAINLQIFLPNHFLLHDLLFFAAILTSLHYRLA
jgi:hypothetical protein